MNNAQPNTHRSALVRHLAIITHLTQQQVAKLLDAYAETVAIGMEKDGKALLPGIGRLTRATRPARSARNPATGETLQIPARYKVKFSPMGDLRLLDGRDAPE